MSSHRSLMQVQEALQYVGMCIVPPLFRPSLSGPIGVSPGLGPKSICSMTITVACRVLDCQKPSIAHRKICVHPHDLLPSVRSLRRAGIWTSIINARAAAHDASAQMIDTRWCASTSLPQARPLSPACRNDDLWFLCRLIEETRALDTMIWTSVRATFQRGSQT
jgi:hypothetical protein